VKKEEIMKRIDRIQWALEQERDKRHREKQEFLRDQWKLEREVQKKSWELNSMLSIHRQEIDQLMMKIYILEEEIKRNKK